MTVRLRAATDVERHGPIRRQWINRCAPQRDGRDAGEHGVRFGRCGHYVSQATATRMVELLVDDVLGSPDVQVTVAVLEAEGIEPELVGWIAYDAASVHFVCVPRGFGRRGFGRALLGLAEQCREASWSTPNGRALQSAGEAAR